MKYFITGGAGFIGSNFVLDWLNQSDEPVINLAKLTYAGNLEKMAQAVELMEETVAADRRRRQRQAEELTARQEVSAKAATETPALSGEGAASEASETSPSSEPAAPSASR